MTFLPVPEYFEGFSYPGHEVTRFSKANNHFQLLLKSGESTTFEPDVKEADKFLKWLLNHNALDAKAPRL